MRRNRRNMIGAVRTGRCHAIRRIALRGVAGILAPACFAVAPAMGGSWPQYAGDAAHASTAMHAPADLSAHLWRASQNEAGVNLVFEGPSSPVVFNGRVFANARVLSGTTHVANKIVAMDQPSGEVVWETQIPKATLNSWSSPAVDLAHGTILIGSGTVLSAIRASDGTVAWTTPLLRSVVNASPVVADDTAPGRALITDYDGAGNTGSLYCINTDDFEADANPFQPGDIVWRETLGGSSGNTPACENGVVYVASITDAAEPGFPGTGHIFAFDLHGADGDRLLWSTGAGEGFFGGVTLNGGYVYAASYDPFGGQDNSTLVKVRAADGQLIWTVPCERTNSIPIVVGNRIYLSAGIPGFGSAPKVEAFEDSGASAVKLWDTFQDTGGALVVGGWTHQPVVCDGVLFCGTISTGNAFFGAYTDLYMLNLTARPDDPDFVIDHRGGVGSSPAVADGRLYSIGTAGLSAIAALGDYCGAADGSGVSDGTVNGADIQCFIDSLLSGAPTSTETALGDFDGDTVLTVSDVQGFIEKLLGE